MEGDGQLGNVLNDDYEMMDGTEMARGVRCRGIERVWRMSGGCREDDLEGGKRVREDRQRVGGEGSRQQ